MGPLYDISMEVVLLRMGGRKDFTSTFKKYYLMDGSIIKYDFVPLEHLRENHLSS